MQIIMVHVGGKGTTTQGQELQLGVLGRLLAPRPTINPPSCLWPPAELSDRAGSLAAASCTGSRETPDRRRPLTSVPPTVDTDIVGIGTWEPRTGKEPKTKKIKLDRGV